MARLSRDDALPVILDAITSKGGKVSHRELVQVLESAGNAAAVLHVPALQKMGKLKGSVVAESEGVTVLYYEKGDK